MNHPIVQCVALTCYANAFLQNRAVEQFFPGNSTCKFCDRVDFVETKKLLFAKLRERTVADTPDEWFSFLKTKKVVSVRLICYSRNDPGIPDRMASAFVGGGGDWGMELLLPNRRSQLWMSRWEVWDRNAAERRIWRVRYGNVFEGDSLSDSVPNLEATRLNLLAALQKIQAFSAKHECGGFTECFSKAITTLLSGQRHGYHPDLAPAGYLEQSAAYLLDACQTAWVFGGMGSWNDMGFDGGAQVEYDEVSEVLFRAIKTAICDAANTTAIARA